MGRRRASANISVTSNEMRWLIENDYFRNVRRFEPLPPGSDLLRAYLAALLRYHDAGWVLHDFSSYRSEFFAHKNGERIIVQISSEDPTLPPRKWTDY